MPVQIGWRMSRKSGYRFSEKDMRNHEQVPIHGE